MQFCEANLCAWIAQPANTWSGLAYVLIGLWLIRKRSVEQAPAIQLIGPSAIFVGITTFAYHASYTFVAQFFDLSSMYIFSGLLLVLNLRRLGVITQKIQMPLFVGIILLSMVILGVYNRTGQAIFALQIIAALLLEAYISNKQKNQFFYRDFGLALLLFLIGYGIWILDFKRILCDPNNHILQGHAVWHILTAFCFLFLYRFYRQFNFDDRDT
jgi:hypothetical protein